MKHVLLMLTAVLIAGAAYGGGIQERIDSVRALIPTAENDSIKLNYQMYITDSYLQLFELDSAIKYNREIVLFGVEANYDKAIGAGLIGIGNAFSYQNKPEEALLYSLSAYEIFERSNHLKGQALTLNAIGKLYHDRGDEHMAISNYRRARDIRLHYKDTISLAHSALYLLNSFVILHQRESVSLDSVEKYAKETFHLASSFKGTRFKPPLAQGYDAMATFHALKGEREEAIALYKQSLALFRKQEHRLLIAGNLKQLGKQYMGLKDYDTAEKYYQEALDLYTKIGASNSILDLQLNLSDLHYAQGKVEQSLQELRNYHVSYDSIVNSKRNDQLVELEAKYETEKKEQQIELLEEEFKVSELEKERQAILLVLAVVAALLAILLFSLIYIFQRSRNRRQRLELERKLLRAQMNPHFIFNSLSSIQRLYIEGDVDLANDFMADFANLLREILDATGKQKVSVRDEIKTLGRYLKLEEARLKGKLTWELNVDEEIDQQIAMMPPLIIQPFVENAIWHGIVPKEGAGHIKIDLYQAEENLLRCKVLDNGVGLDLEKDSGKLHESKGIKLSEMRLGRGNAVQIGPARGGGVMVNLKIDIDYAT